MKVNGINQATSLIIALNSVTALRIYEQPKNKRRYVLVWLYNILFMCMFGASMLTFEMYQLLEIPHSLERIMYTFLTFVYVLDFVCTLGLGWYHSKNSLTLRRRMTQVDEKLKKLGVTIDYRVVFNRGLIIGAIWLVNAAIMCGFYVKWWREGKIGLLILITAVTFACGSNIGAVILYEFVIYVYWLGLRFEHINDLLKTFIVEGRQIKSKEPIDLVKTDESTANYRHQLPRSLNRWLSENSFRRSQVFPVNQANLKHEAQSVRKVHLLQEIRFVHLYLCSFSKMLNSTFDAQLLLYISTTILYLTVTLYYTYYEINKTWVHLVTDGDAGVIVISIVDSLYNCMKITVASYICECTIKQNWKADFWPGFRANSPLATCHCVPFKHPIVRVCSVTPIFDFQANKIIEIIHCCSVHEFDTEMRDELLQFSLQISLSQLGDSRSHFFRLNYTFLRGCISFVTTYLVIMIQWSQTIEAESTAHYENETTSM